MCPSTPNNNTLIFLDEEKAKRSEPLGEEKAKRSEPLGEEKAKRSEPLGEEKAKRSEPLGEEKAKRSEPLGEEKAKRSEPLGEEKAKRSEPLGEEKAKFISMTTTKKMEERWLLIPECECYLVDEVSTSPPKVNHVCPEKSCESQVSKSLEHPSLRSRLSEARPPKSFGRRSVDDRAVGPKD